MDIRKIKKLIELVEESGISELEISEGEEVSTHQSYAGCISNDVGTSTILYGSSCSTSTG